MFFPNYSKPGKGVNKRDPNQPIIKTFFEILPRKLWNLCKLNWLYVLTAIPFFLVTVFLSGIITSPIINTMMALVPDVEFYSAFVLFDLILRIAISLFVMVFWGVGPFTAGMTYITRNYGQEEHCWLFSDYFEKSKQNLKQSIALWIIDMVVFYLLMGALNFYTSSSMYIMVFILSFVILIYTMMHMYVYQMMITFDLKLIDILKNALLLSFGCAPRNLLLMLILLALHVALPIVLYMLFQNLIVIVIFVILELCLLPTLSSFVVNFFIHPILQKYVNRDSNAAE